MSMETTESLIENVGSWIIEAKENEQLKNELIKQYMPFIIKCVSDFVPGYIIIGDHDELSIGLMAFNEAIDRYDSQKGPFFPYARLVINSRMTTYLNQNRKRPISVPLEWAETLALESSHYSSTDLEEQIDIWKAELAQFNITFTQLVKHKPKHKDTRDRAFEIAELSSQSSLIVRQMFQKLRLPIQLIHKHVKVSVKVIDKSKLFITAVVIVFVKELGAIKQWIK